LAYVIRDNGILNLRHDNNYVHEKQGNIVDRIFVILFLVYFRLMIPRANVDAPDEDDIGDAVQCQKDRVPSDLFWRDDSYFFVTLDEEMNE